MKKFTFAIVAFAAMLFASCGNKTQQATDEVDTTKSFEQQQIEASIKMHLDSLAAQVDSKQFASIEESAKSGNIKLSDEEKKVKPDYLLDAAIANDLATIGQKYAAVAMFNIDSEVAKLYDMDNSAYTNALGKLTADINDPAFKKMEETDGDYNAKHQALYKEMDAEGRINFYWVLTSAATVENLYIMSQNIDKYLEGYTDEQVANITFRLICIIDALEALSVYDPDVVGISEALEPLKNINSTTVAEFKQQLGESKEALAASRDSFIK